MQVFHSPLDNLTISIVKFEELQCFDFQCSSPIPNSARVAFQSIFRAFQGIAIV